LYLRFRLEARVILIAVAVVVRMDVAAVGVEISKVLTPCTKSWTVRTRV